MYQSYTDPIVAMNEWEDAVRHFNYCLIRNVCDLPNQTVIKSPPTIGVKYSYLQPDNGDTRAQYRVVFRGLSPGIYTSWYVCLLIITLLCLTVSIGLLLACWSLVFRVRCVVVITLVMKPIKHGVPLRGMALS